MYQLELNDEQIIELFINMEKSKQDLLNLISYFHCDDSREYWDANTLITTRSDLEQWMEFYDGDPENIVETNQMLRRWKIDQSQINFSEFKDLLSLDPEDFVSTIFQQDTSERYMDDLDTYLADQYSLEKLYFAHRQNPYSRMEYLLIR